MWGIRVFQTYKSNQFRLSMHNFARNCSSEERQKQSSFSKFGSERSSFLLLWRLAVILAIWVTSWGIFLYSSVVSSHTKSIGVSAGRSVNTVIAALLSRLCAFEWLKARSPTQYRKTLSQRSHSENPWREKRTHRFQLWNWHVKILSESTWNRSERLDFSLHQRTLLRKDAVLLTETDMPLSQSLWSEAEIQKKTHS